MKHETGPVKYAQRMCPRVPFGVVVVESWFNVPVNNISGMSNHCLQICRTFIRPEKNGSQILLQLQEALPHRHQAAHIFRGLRWIGAGVLRLTLLFFHFVLFLRCQVGWLFGFNGPLRQYFSLYQAVSQREGEREKGEKRTDESKNVQTTSTRTYYKRSRPLPYCNPNCRTPQHWKFTQHHRTTRPPPLRCQQIHYSRVTLNVGGLLLRLVQLYFYISTNFKVST